MEAIQKNQAFLVLAQFVNYLRGFLMANNSALAAARARLQVLDPFLGAASLYLNIEEKPLEWFQVHCGHIEPTAATDGVNLFYYAPFIESLSPKERCFVVAHETMHCVAQDFSRRGPRHPVGWNIAGDYRIHCILKEAGWEILPKALYDAKFNGLSAEEIYDLLKQDAQQKQKAGGNQGGEGIEAFWPEEGFGGSVMEPTSPSGGKADSSQQEALGKQWTLRAAQAAEVAKAAGNLPGVYARTVTEALEPKIPWQEVLRRFIRDSRARLGDDYQWLPANRRHRWRDLILPSRERIGMGLLDIHVDLSGSIGPRELAEFVAEIQGIRADASPELTRVIYFDTEVGWVDLLGPEDRLEVDSVRGGGGTDLGAAFRWVEKSGMRPVATVVLTDLYGPFEAKKPSSPVVWAIAKGGSKEPPPYGDVVFIEAE